MVLFVLVVKSGLIQKKKGKKVIPKPRKPREPKKAKKWIEQ